MLRLPLLTFASIAATGVCAAGTAAAETPAGVATYALVVGSNAGGPGQTDLRYAEEDARRMGRVLTELGGYPAAAVEVVVAPTPDRVRASIAALGERVAADLAAGRKSRVLFYYSGHARATALDLGDAQLPLAELRTRLFSVPATLTVVVLDACQSGAFSRVKGAEPAADFSFNSRHQLDASGIAVLASSSGSELSQESAELRSSYFTHHLLVGMRGAGDANHDGQVSIDEAYRYAYHQTLLATAETAVGGQHVSLEVDLKGHGEVPLSFPRAATSSIALPAGLEGKALVQDRRARAVVAETYKAKGAPVRIAVAPGDYEVLVRRGTQLSRCQVTAGPGGTTVDLGRCTTESIVVGTSKGATTFARSTRVELTLGGGAERQDDYTGTLANFGYAQQGFFPLSTGVDLAVTHRLGPRLWLGGMLAVEQAPTWRRFDTDTELAFDWTTTRLGALARGLQPFAASGWLSRFGVYGQLGAGLALGRTRFVDAAGMTTRETHLGPALSFGLGLHGESGWIEGLGFSAGWRYDYTPAVENLTGDTHASGGHRVTYGVSYSF